MTDFETIDVMLSDLLVNEPEFITHAKENSIKNHLPEYEVSASQGKFLYLITKLNRSARVLEIGTLGGYSTLWFAHAIKSKGKVVTLEIDSNTALVAQQNIDSSPYKDTIDIKVGPATKSLQKMIENQEPKFDLIFIDADKENNAIYLNLAYSLSQKGTVIIADNIVRDGKILDKNSKNPSVSGVKKYLNELSTNDNYDSAGIITAGIKGIDGFSLTIVN